MKNFIYGSIFVVAVVIYVGYGMSSNQNECETLEKAAKASISEAQACETDSDCVFTRFNCPFDCITPLHRDKTAEASEAVSAYSKSCMMFCPECPKAGPRKLACENSRCVAY